MTRPPRPPEGLFARRAEGLAAERCPAAVRARARALWAERAADRLAVRLKEALLGPGAAPARRGAPTTLRRLAAGAVALDLTPLAARGGRPRLLLALAEAPAAARVSLEIPGRARPLRVRLGAARSAAVALPRGTREVIVVVEGAGPRPLRSARIPLA